MTSRECQGESSVSGKARKKATAFKKYLNVIFTFVSTNENPICDLLGIGTYE